MQSYSERKDTWTLQSQRKGSWTLENWRDKIAAYINPPMDPDPK